MNIAFGARGKRRLNWVFDAISFIYLDDCFPFQSTDQKRKSCLKSPSGASKKKRVKILTNRPKSNYVERAAVIPTLSTAAMVETKVPSLKDDSHAISKVTTLDFYTLTCLVFWQKVCFILNF
jgi:hypothetical protein